jgi:tetratricopeptide (TPR) repeat protein
MPRRGAKTGRHEITLAEINERLAKLESQDFFEMLGIDQKASAAQIQAAYFQLAKTWHPDRLPPQLRDQKDLVAKIFAKLNEAHRTLTDPAKRDHYLEQLVTGGSAANRGEVQRFVDAAKSFQLADALCKQGSYAKAAELLKQCVDADSEPPEYPTLLAWVEAQLLDTASPPHTAGGSAEAGPYAEQIAVLTRIIDEHESFERAVFYRAELFKRSGDHDRALRDYRRAAKLNPRNIDAKRELRLHEMRGRTADKPAEDAGLLGRFFGRGKGS